MISLTPNADYRSDYSSDHTQISAQENAHLEHYENDLEKLKENYLLSSSKSSYNDNSLKMFERLEKKRLAKTDERDAIQKKTFTKWVNKHLQKTNRNITDLFTDLSDGYNLIALLEILTSERLPKETGYTRFHRIQNIQICLDFLKKQNIKFVNIRPEDILEGNPKLTLGLIWTIILNYQVSIIKTRQKELLCQDASFTTSYSNDPNNSSTFSNNFASFQASQDSQQQVDTNPTMNHSKSGNGSVTGSHYSTTKTNGNIPIERINRDQIPSGFSGPEESIYHSGSQYRTNENYYHNNNHRQNNDIIPYSSNTGNYSMNRHYDTAYNANFGQGFSESSSYETREHYERKVQRVKKTRGERERNSFRSKNKYGSKNVSEVLRHSDNGSARDALLQWARKATEGYPGVNVSNFTNSWRDGLAFNAILHRYRPNLIDWTKISDKNVTARGRLDNAFNIAEKEFGVSKLLDAEDVDCDHPDEKSVITYVSSLYNALPHLDELSRYMNVMDNYIQKATLLRQWILEATNLMEIKNEYLLYSSPLLLLEELNKFEMEDLPSKAALKKELSQEYDIIKKALNNTEYFIIPVELSTYTIEEIWENLLRAIHFRNIDLVELSKIQGNLNDLISKLNRGIGLTNEKLDHILSRIEDIEARAETINVREGERIISEIIDDLNALEPTINGFFDDVEILKNNHHPDESNIYKQVYGLHQRREAYLDRVGGSILSKFNIRTETIRRENIQRLEAQRETSFRRVEECIEWIRVRMERLNNMDFNMDLEQLEDIFENHKLENRDIQDFRQDVDECIARQAEVTVEDSYEYCELLRTLESEYQQLRDLSAGRMLDLDSLIAFIRAAQIELIWISQREDIEVSRNWSDINQLDLPMLQNYYKQLLHEIELREKQFNDVHNQGAALINQRHPAVELIESYLKCMSSQWEWLLSLSKALEGHLRDALNLRSFLEEADKVEQWMKLQTEHLEKNYNHNDFSLDEGEQYLAELNEIKEMLNKYHGILMGLTEKSSQISPLWQRGERISRSIIVTALCDYNNKDINIRSGDECTLLNNDDMIYWKIRGIDGVEGKVPSVVFRIPPPDPRLTSFLNRLHALFEKMKKLWEKKHRLIRYNMILNTMKTIRNWDLDTFMSLDPDQRDAIIKALNEDTMKLLSEMDPNDPLALRLREELRNTNEHFYNLLNESMKPPEPDHSSQFDDAFASLAKKLEEAWEKLTSRVKEPIADDMDKLEKNIMDHKAFEDALQSLDSDVSNVKELFRQILNPSPSQRANNDFLTTRWEDLWDLSRMYVDRLKALELVLNGIQEVNDIVKQHEITLSSFDDLPADLSKLRGAHSQLVELNMILQQQQSIVDSLNKNIALLRQHVARTRYNASNHPDVDSLDEQVQNLTVRWENISSQVQERMRLCEKALQIQMVYRSEYQCEIDWLDRVESTINSLRNPDQLRPEEYQRQLDTLIAEYSQLQERTEAIEKVNREGGKYIREAKSYDNRLGVFRDTVIDIHGHGIKLNFKRQTPQPLNGADQVTEELEKLNRRFAQLSSFILEKRNEMQILIQNWKKKKQEEEDKKRAELEAQRQAFEQARRKALEEADRLRAEREEAERLRREQQAERERKRLQEEADRLRREQEAERERQRLADEAERLRRAQEAERERQRLADEADRLRREQEELDRLKREQEERDRLRREQEERDRLRREKELADKLKKVPEFNINNAFEMNQASNLDNVDEFENLEAVPDKAKISEYEDEMQTYSEETETKTQFYEMEGILHKQTGEILTFVEAIRQGLLDLHSNGGEFFDIHTGSKISLEKAAELGFIKESFNDILNKKLGIYHPETKQSLKLIEAIQQNLYNPETRQITDIHSGEVLLADELMSKGILNSETQIRLITAGILKFPPMSLEHAIEQGVLDVESGEFKGKYSSTTLSLQDSLINSYIKISNSGTPMIAVTLSDVIDNGLINGETGEFIDKNSNDKFNLREACSKKTNLLNRNIKEITKTDNLEKISLGDATVRNVINTRAGNFTDTEHKQGISLQQAKDRGWICKPMTLYELVKKDQIDSTNHFIDKGSRQRFSLLQSIAYGLIDPDVRHIVDIDEKDVISLSEALERGVIEADGLYHIVSEKRKISLYEALDEGLLTRRVKHNIFDVKGITNTENGIMINLREAINEGIIIPQSERFIDIITKDSYSLSQAAERSFIDKALYELITSSIGMKDSYGNDMNIIRGVSEGVIDLDKGIIVVKEHGSTRELTAFDAYHNGHLTLRGSMKLASLLDIPPTLVSSRKKVDGKKRIRRPGQHHVLGDDQVKITLAEAMKQGLIDSRTQRFRQGDIDVTLEEALSQGLLSENSEWIIPAKALGTGPTIEEKVDESVTETAQQLAPKIFPDKNIEESVTTVKRVRRTETSAVGGPGGVSVYRAITGAKGAVEVPTDGYHFREAERKGFIDLDNGIITPPTTDKKMSIEEAINIGFLDGNSITMTDPKSGKEVTATEGFDLKIMTPYGKIKHHGKEYSLKDAIEKNIVRITFESPANNNSLNKKIIQFATGNGGIMSFKPVGTPMIEEHEISWSFDANTGELIDLTTNERINLDKALSKGKLSYDDLRVRDTITGREMSFAEAEKWGVVDAKNSYYLDKQNNHRYSFTEAAKQHKIYPAGGVPENASDAINTTVKVQTRVAVSKKEAIPIGNNQFASLTIGKLIKLGNFDNTTGMFINPENKQQMTLKSMIMKGFVDPYGTTIKDKQNYRELSLLDAIQENIVDDINGTVTDTNTGKIYDLKSALENDLIKDKGIKDSFEDSLVSGRLSMTSGLYTTSEGNKIPIPQAIKKDLLDGDSLMIKDPATGNHMTYNDAVTKRVVDPSTGHITNIQTEERMSFPKALTTGLVSAIGASPVSSYSTPKGTHQRIIEQKLQFTPYSPEIKYDENLTSSAVAVRQPGDSSHKVVDLGGGKQVTVKVVRDSNGLEKGEYVDPTSGMKFTIQLNSDPFVTETKTTVKSTAQVQSVELEPHAEFVGIDRIRDKRTDRVMSLADAERLGLAKVDKKGKQTTKTYAVFRSNIQTAVNKGVIDNNGDKISLEDAIKVGIIDIEKLTYKSASTKEELSLSQASNMGLLDITLSETLSKGISHPVSGEKISVKDGINIGIINKYTGSVINPFTNEKLTWLDIVKPVYASLTMEGIYDPTKGYGIPITAALCEGLINVEDNLYVNVISGDKFSIDQARAKGLIDGSTYKVLVEPLIPNYKTGRNINLIEAVKIGIFNPRNKTIQLNQFTVTPISKAVNEGKIPKEVGDKLRQVERMSFVDALGKGNIDLVHDTFTDIDSGNQMTISQAVEKGYIDPGTVEKFSEGDEKNLSNIIKCDEFDENSGRIRDKQTGLYLTFKNAIEKGIIDGDSLIHDVDRSQTVTLNEAINRKKIDNDGKYIHKNGEKFKLTDAIKYGFIALIASPMQAAQAVADAIKKRDSEGYKFKIEPISGDSEKRYSSGPKWRTMETTTVKLTPIKNEPGLSTKIRSSISEDIRKSRAASIIDDPQGLADLQFEFLDNLRKSNFNIDDAVIENPANNKRVSIKEAAESGLLDIITGEIVNQKTGRRYSIPKAVHMKIMEPEAGKQIMENLNMTVEEISGSSSHKTTHGSHVDDDGTRTSWSKTVQWTGNPSDLRSKSPNIQTSYTVYKTSSHLD
uniref:Calponin-homology (CH) domain-containing protein n=1 Tax=Strongyloides stercoralis TaxID=6248 RepID=A0A913I6X8_STRER